MSDGISQDVSSLKRQVRPLIPALHQMLRLAGQSGAIGQTLASPGPEPVRKFRPTSVGSKGKHPRSLGSSSSAGHGNVLRTPFGEREEDKERVNVVAILSNLQSLSGTLDGLKAKLVGNFLLSLLLVVSRVLLRATFAPSATDLCAIVPWLQTTALWEEAVARTAASASLRITLALVRRAHVRLLTPRWHPATKQQRNSG